MADHRLLAGDLTDSCHHILPYKKVKNTTHPVRNSVRTKKIKEGDYRAKRGPRQVSNALVLPRELYCVAIKEKRDPLLGNKVLLYH